MPRQATIDDRSEGAEITGVGIYISVSQVILSPLTLTK